MHETGSTHVTSAAPGTAVCELTDVTRSFRGREVVRGLSLRVEAGEMVALTGRSGCGKSTVLNMIGLLDRPTSGDLRLFDRSAPRPGSRGARRLLAERIGYLFQSFALLDEETAEGNLRVAQAWTGGTRRSRAEMREEALATVGLADHARDRVYELSGGEQQRLALARLALRPRALVLADEPTGSLDPANRARVLDLLDGMRRRGTAVVIVTHDPEVAAACSRVVSLERGHRATTGGA
ncbi:ATP-binding cassette domain-containing protein [Clavibacter tessellarius]|uniref:ATP-binding cassette domain-containing protein n=1 Tax=Clavibacter tessellarius TaxID=31965 RepID=UPI003247D66D